MSFINVCGIGAAVVALAIPGVAVAQYSPDASSVMKRLRSDPKVSLVLQSIRDSYYPAPDMNSAVNRCVAAASLIPAASVWHQADACLRTMVGGLDPNSAYLNAEEYKFLMGSPGEGAIGLEIRKIDSGAEIVSIIDGSPGAQAGIVAGTQIVAIDGKPAAPMFLPNIAVALRGPVGSVVQLDVIPPESSEVVRFEVRRERIWQAGITAKMMDGRLGYIQIPVLGSSLAEELAEALRYMLILQLQPLKGVVVDLRDCPGGLFQGAIALAAVFLPEDAVVVTMASRREGERIYRARQQDASTKNFDPRPLFEDASLRAAAQKIPLVVLVNHGTASGAEAAAAALQEAGRAYVIGQATAGIGSAQTLLPLKDKSAIRITTDVMRTASGKSWAEQGIRPDFQVSQALPVRRGKEIAQDPWMELAAEHFAKR